MKSSWIFRRQNTTDTEFDEQVRKTPMTFYQMWARSWPAFNDYMNRSTPRDGKELPRRSPQ